MMPLKIINYFPFSLRVYSFQMCDSNIKETSRGSIIKNLIQKYKKNTINIRKVICIVGATKYFLHNDCLAKITKEKIKNKLDTRNYAIRFFFSFFFLFVLCFTVCDTIVVSCCNSNVSYIRISRPLSIHPVILRAGSRILRVHVAGNSRGIPQCAVNTGSRCSLNYILRQPQPA